MSQPRTNTLAGPDKGEELLYAIFFNNIFFNPLKYSSYKKKKEINNLPNEKISKHKKKLNPIHNSDVFGNFY